MGIIYNHPLHDSDEEMTRPLGMKLDNPVIRKMIKELLKNYKLNTTRIKLGTGDEQLKEQMELLQPRQVGNGIR